MNTITRKKMEMKKTELCLLSKMKVKIIQDEEAHTGLFSIQAAARNTGFGVLQIRKSLRTGTPLERNGMSCQDFSDRKSKKTKLEI